MRAALTCICIALLVAASVFSVHARSGSFIYIQGDKIIPFYVKLGDKMQPRYGKNYCIISGLSAGSVTIEILFQQNVLPPRTFTVDVPENGCRAFLLNRQENGYELYDLQTKKYVHAKE